MTANFAQGEGSLPPADYSELLEILWRLHVDAASGQDITRLESLVCGQAAARKIYLDYIELCGRLQWMSDRRFEVPPGDAAPARENGPSPSLTRARPLHAPVEDAARSQRFWKNLGFSVSLALFAVAVGLMVLAAFRFPEARRIAGPAEGDPSDAALKHVVRIAAVSPDLATVRPANLKTGATLAVGEPIELTKGWIELRFTDGARVVVEAPAVFIPEGKNGGLLNQGRLVASVNRRSAGFTLNTPHATIVDLGTEFGVELGRDAQVDVHVFEGAVAVDYRRPGQNGPEQVRLEANRAVRFSALNPEYVELPCEPDRFVRSDDIPDPALVWSDEFTGEKLHTEWTWLDPDNDDRYSLTERPGYLRVHVGDLEDAWVSGDGFVEGAPYLFRSLDDLPVRFAMETFVDLHTAQGDSVKSSIGGLLVYDENSQRMAINLGLQNMAGKHEVVLHSLGKIHAIADIDTPMLRLKLVRNGDKWFAYHGRQSSNYWTLLGSVREHELSGGPIVAPRIGLISKTWKTSPPNGAMIDFKYFRVTSPIGTKVGATTEIVPLKQEP